MVAIIALFNKFIIYVIVKKHLKVPDDQVFV